MDTVSSLLGEKGAQVFSAPPSKPVFDVALLMLQHHVGAILIAEGGSPVGIISERDVLTRVLLKGVDPRTTPARDIMTEDLIVVSPATPIREAMAVMTKQRCRHLPVLEDGRLAGVISIGDCTRWVSKAQEFTIHHMRDYIADKYPR